MEEHKVYVEFVSGRQQREQRLCLTQLWPASFIFTPKAEVLQTRDKS